MDSVTHSRLVAEAKVELTDILKELPYDSSTNFVLSRLHPYLGKDFPVLYRNIVQQDGTTMGKWDFAIRAALGSTILAGITCWALTTLANVSLIASGSFGVCKI